MDELLSQNSQIKAGDLTDKTLAKQVFLAMLSRSSQFGFFNFKLTTSLVLKINLKSVMQMIRKKYT